MRKSLKKKSVISIISLLLIAMSSSSLVFANEAYTVSKDGVVTETVSGMRAKACKRMNDMASVKWELDETLRYCSKKNSDGTLDTDSKVSLNKYLHGDISGGIITRTGIPYSQVYREFSSTTANPFIRKLEPITVINEKTYYSVKGVDCSSAVSFAWRTAAKNDLPSYTDDFMKMTRKKKGSNSSSKNIYTTRALLRDATKQVESSFTVGDVEYKTGCFVSLVGSYGDYAAYNSDADYTTTIVDGIKNYANYPTGENVYNQVYAKILPGDALIARNANYGHVRLVTNVEIFYTDSKQKRLMKLEAKFIGLNRLVSRRDNTTLLLLGTYTSLILSIIYLTAQPIMVIIRENTFQSE